MYFIHIFFAAADGGYCRTIFSLSLEPYSSQSIVDASDLIIAYDSKGAGCVGEGSCRHTSSGRGGGGRRKGLPEWEG